ncbi:MAG: hypothetical protein SGJ01_01530 [Gemmatimonadota bacterium]|nr:hypothetical protein [Gemmatimonadota bacterium]
MIARSMLQIALLAAVMPGCSNNPTGPGSVYNPVIPTSWASGVTNTWFPLVPGTVKNFTGQTPGGLETITYEVLQATRVVHGVTAAVVLDRVYLDGNLIEETFDWFAQDAAGNVWYLGEESREISNGQVLNTEGSWEWGVDGALPGIYMWADPAAHVGEEYRQEYYKGVAEDLGKVISLAQNITVPGGSFTNCIVTEDRVGADPSQPLAHKTYCPQVGSVHELALDGSTPVVLESQGP